MKKILCIELVGIFCIFSLLIVVSMNQQNVQAGISEAVGNQLEMEDASKVKDTLETEAVIKKETLTESENAGEAERIEESEPEEDNGLTEDIVLVNKDNALPEDYEVTLKTMPDRVNRAAEEAYQPLCDMLSAGRREGLAFEICSSYRSVERQQELFDEDVAALIRKGFSYQEAYEEVARETMPPGHSEHSTGLAFDIVSLGYQILDAKQEKTAENKWLQEHCAEYGFILRYPKGKEEITHINYESWHYRYVGVEIAQYIMENEITLEEYLGEA